CRTPEQVLDRLLRCSTHRRTLVNTTAHSSFYAVDTCRRRDCSSDLLAEPDLEYSASLAVSRADAEHSRDRKRRHTFARHVSLAAGADVEPGEFSFLDWRAVV